MWLGIFVRLLTPSVESSNQVLLDILPRPPILILARLLRTGLGWSEVTTCLGGLRALALDLLR